MQTSIKLSNVQVRSEWLVEMWVCKQGRWNIISNLDCGEGKTPQMSIGARCKGREPPYKENRVGITCLFCGGPSWPPAPSPEGHRPQPVWLWLLGSAGWELCIWLLLSQCVAKQQPELTACFCQCSSTDRVRILCLSASAASRLGN